MAVAWLLNLPVVAGRNCQKDVDGVLFLQPRLYTCNFFQMFISVICLYVQFYTFLLIAHVGHIVLLTGNKPHLEGRAQIVTGCLLIPREVNTHAVVYQ